MKIRERFIKVFEMMFKWHAVLIRIKFTQAYFCCINAFETTEKILAGNLLKEKLKNI